MSIMFGVRRSANEMVGEPELHRMSLATARYAPDGSNIYVAGRMGMGYQPYHTHARSTLDPDPTKDGYGNVVVVDGRLDNYEELRNSLGLADPGVSESSIILTAFSRWGEGCFSKFIGEWALALWSAKDELIYLSRDHAGTRTLYFSHTGGRLTWSTHLETLISDPHSFDIDKDYARRYIASIHLGSLTPYRGVHAVAAAQYIVVGESDFAVRYHWECSEREHIAYRTDTEYGERFLSLLGQSVARRTGLGAPIIAQLSGGMDSSTIVCMSDRLRRGVDPSAPLLDTISFYDDTEPSWNEKPFYSVVEARRGKRGTHIPMSLSTRSFLPSGGIHGTYLLPGADTSAIEMESIVNAGVGDRGYRVIISGIGGDEVLGGSPDPFPELASLLFSGDCIALVRKAVEWCLVRQTTLLKLLLKTLSFATTLRLHPSAAYATEAPPWIPLKGTIAEEDRRLEDTILRGRINDTPNDICNRIAWRAALETLPTLFPEFLSRYEYRYPFLDRDLVEYAFSIPRDQLVRPGRRRYLMRQALANIVPTEIIERKRKAFVSQPAIVVARCTRCREIRLRRGAGR